MVKIEGGVHFHSPASAKPADPLPAYLGWLELHNSAVRVQDIAKGVVNPDAKPLQLHSVFVDLNVKLKIKQGLSLREHRQREREREAQREGIGQLPRSIQRGLMEDPRGEPSETRPVTVFETVGEHPRLVLVGDAGSGKSTVGQFLTLALARARLGDDSLQQRLGATWLHGSLLPVPLVLRDFAARLPEGHPQGRARDVWTALRAALEDGEGKPEWADAIRRIAGQDGVLFLLDGWDETHDPARLAAVAEAVADLIAANPKSRFLLTSRPYAWDSVLLAAEEKADPSFLNLKDQQPKLLFRLQAAFRNLPRQLAVHYQVAPLEAPQIEAFIQNWYRAVQEGIPPWFGATEAALKKADLETAAAREDLQPVVTNPLLLTLTASLSGTHLPDDRADLFDQIVELLLGRWTRRSGSDKSLLEAVGCELPHKDIRQKIQACAFAAHQGNVGQSGVADIPEYSLQRAFASLLQGDENRARKVVEFVERRAGLLISRGLKDGCRQFCCPHRAFQEFLAACHLREQAAFISSELVHQPDEVPSALALARANAGHWREVLCYAARLAGDDFGSIAAHNLVHGESFAEWSRHNAPTAVDWRCAVLAGKQLLEIRPEKLRRGTEVMQRRLAHVAGWLAATIESFALESLRERFEASVDLARLGDPREGVGVDETTKLPKLAWTDELPAGVFTLARNRQTVRIERPYRLSRYPVTVAQFQAFVDDKGYEQDEFWSSEGRAWRDGKQESEDLPNVYRAYYRKLAFPLRGPQDYEPVFQTPNHPRVGVSWYEAAAFCAWLTERLRAADGGSSRHEEALTAGKDGSSLPRLLPGEQIRLPHEAEWEQAARWSKLQSRADDRTYPWGESDEQDLPQHCNCEKTGLGHISAVGLLPKGQADCGALDLSGNVWEWCENWHDADEKYRGLRGGSWINNDPANLSCAYRNHNHPGNRNNNLGFRCVVGLGAAVRKVSTGFGQTRRGERPCAASAKRDHLTLASVPPGGKRRGGRPWPVTAVRAKGSVRESHGPSTWDGRRAGL